MYKILTSIIVFVLIIIKPANGQDPTFTQFYANPLFINPAFAGTANGARFVAHYRNQWPSISGNYVTYTTSYDQHFDAIGGGIGLQFLYDKAGDGDLTTTSASFVYSYHLNVSPKFTIKAALQTEVSQKSIDFSKLLFGDMIDPIRGFIYDTRENLPADGRGEIKPYLDFAAGILGFTKTYYAGFAVHHINKPSISFLESDKSLLERKITGHVGMMIPLEKVRQPKNFFSPNLLFQKQGNFIQINLGAYYIKDHFLTGLWMRQTSANMDAFILLAGVIKDPLKIGYSYDITFSQARIGAKGSHELSLTLQFKPYKKAPSVKWRKLFCPSF